MISVVETYINFSIYLLLPGWLGKGGRNEEYSKYRKK